MKKTLIKFISATLCVCFVFTGCSKGAENKKSDYNASQQTAQNYRAEIREDNIIVNGKGLYKIVIPAEAAFLEEYAGSEIAKYLKLSTGCNLDIVFDNQTSLNDKLICIGDNNFVSDAKITLNKAETGDDGFIIKTVGDDIFVLGGSPTGTVYAAYELLSNLISFEPYSPDEIFYLKSDSVSLFDFDILEVPSFVTRSINSPTWHAAGKVFDALLMRVSPNDSNGNGALIMSDDGNVDRDWGLFAHSLGAALLPWSKYHDAHPEWYVGSEGVGGAVSYQVVMSNPDVINEVADNLKTYFTKYPDARYFMVGINDNNVAPSEDKALADVNGGYGGAYMIFLNQIDEKISEWLKEEGIERDYRIVGLAYMKYVDAPVDANGEPVNQNVIARKNVGIMYAPISLDWDDDITAKGNEVNEPLCANLSGWGKVVNGNMFIWSYSTSFREYLIDFNNISTLRSNYRFYRDCGTIYLFDQGVSQTNIPFKPLRDYVQSKLAWDLNEDTDILINDFIDHYYKVAASYIRDLFYKIRMNYEYLNDKGILTYIYCGNNSRGELLKKEFWSFTFCKESLELIDNAIFAIERSALPANEKEILISRVKLDSIMPRYIMLSLYRSNLLTSEYKKMVEEFEKDCKELNVRNYCETYGGENISGVIEGFKGKM